MRRESIFTILSILIVIYKLSHAVRMFMLTQLKFLVFSNNLHHSFSLLWTKVSHNFLRQLKIGIPENLSLFFLLTKAPSLSLKWERSWRILRTCPYGNIWISVEGCMESWEIMVGRFQEMFYIYHSYVLEKSAIIFCLDILEYCIRNEISFN